MVIHKIRGANISLAVATCIIISCISIYCIANVKNALVLQSAGIARLNQQYRQTSVVEIVKASLLSAIRSKTYQSVSDQLVDLPELVNIKGETERLSGVPVEITVNNVVLNSIPSFNLEVKDAANKVLYRGILQGLVYSPLTRKISIENSHFITDQMGVD